MMMMGDLPPRRKRFLAGGDGNINSNRNSNSSGNRSSYIGGMNGGGRSCITLVQDHNDTDADNAALIVGYSQKSNSNGKVSSGDRPSFGRMRNKSRTKSQRWKMTIYITLLATSFWRILHYFSIGYNSSNEDAISGEGRNTMNNGIERILKELPNDDSPLTEEIELQILSASHDTIHQFPISIGTDTNGKNPNWETIVHPATEAMLYFNKGEARRARVKKRMTPSDLAKTLSRYQQQQLRGSNSFGGPSVKRDNGNEDADQDDEGLMRVPKFWDPFPYGIIADERERRLNKSGGGAGGSTEKNSTDPTLQRESGVRRYLGNYGSRLMTPVEAKSIGSRIPINNDKNTTNTATEPVLLETIFIAVASYRDWQCSRTVESAFTRASYPERLRVAVVDQIRIGIDTPCSVPPNGTCDARPDQAACKYKSQIDYLTVDAELSVGPVFARHLGNRLYRGEYFAVQSDAHVEFTNGWDTEIIEQWHSAKNEMAVLSTYLSGVEDHIDLTTGNRTSLSRPIMCQSDYEGSGVNKHLRHGQQPEGIPYIHDMPTLHPFWAAGFSFGRGHFVLNVPYDQHLPWIFQGEEISIGLRGFS